MSGLKIKPVQFDSKGEAVNINADDAASALAVSTKAAHLIFLSNVSGVLDRNGKRINTLHIKNIRSLIENGVIEGGMIPKVQSAVAAIKKGVREVDIVNGFDGIKWNRGTRILP